MQSESDAGTGTIPILVYVNDERDWAAWSIDRVPQSNGSRTFWFIYQVRKHGDKIGDPHDRLRDAKAAVERTGREP